MRILKLVCTFEGLGFAVSMIAHDVEVPTVGRHPYQAFLAMVADMQLELAPPSVNILTTHFLDHSSPTVLFKRDVKHPDQFHRLDIRVTPPMRLLTHVSVHRWKHSGARPMFVIMRCRWKTGLQEILFPDQTATPHEQASLDMTIHSTKRPVERLGFVFTGGKWEHQPIESSLAMLADEDSAKAQGR